ncbi:MAG: hypothetical protein QM751_04415 [Paludibacteraceae bacterium]
MKTIKLFLSILSISLLFVNCSSKEQIAEMTGIVVKAQPIAQQAVKGNTNTATESVNTVFTGDDIISYNEKTGEIIFKNYTAEKNLSTILQSFNDKLDFYLNGELLFSLKSKIVFDIDNAIYNEPVLHYSTLDGDKYYIRDGYPWGFPIDDSTSVRTDQAVSVEQTRRVNAEKIMNAWNKLIDELKKEGKYVKN